MISQQYLKENFKYCESSGHMYRLNGQKIGWITNRGYVRTEVIGKAYMVHRLIWLYVNGCFPELEIDHINGDKSDNRYVNLRLATRTENMMNMKKPAHNTSGFKGVSWHKNKWEVYIKLNKKQTYVGSSKDPKVAYAMYCEAATKYYGQFARFG